MKFVSFLAASLGPSTVSAFCGYNTHIHPRSEHGEVPIATFSYNGETGPLGWYGLNTSANRACALGRYQSPINVLSGQLHSVSGGSLRFSIEGDSHGHELENLGSTLEVVGANGTITLGGTKYSLRQFHFHTPSEHHLDGVHYSGEVHFVFSTPGTLAV